MKLERVLHETTDKSTALYSRSFRTAVPREDELSSAASHVGQPHGEDPFAAQMGEATRRPSVDRASTENYSQTAALAIESVNDELGDETDVDSKQRRIENAMQSGDSIEDCFVSSFKHDQECSSYPLPIICWAGAEHLTCCGGRRCTYVPTQLSREPYDSRR